MKLLLTSGDFANLLRVTMAEQNVKAVDLSKRVGVSPEYLSELRSGKRNPTLKVMVAILEALGLELVVQPKAV